MNAQAIAIVEWLAAVLGAINIVLLVRRTAWNYPFGMAMVALYILVFYEERLYAEAGLQVFFFLAQAYGWHLWLKAAGRGERVPVRWLDWPSRAVWTMVTAALSLNLGWVMHRFTDATVPYADAAITGASIAAQLLLALRRVENWIVWIAIDAGAILLYVERGLYPTAALYCGFLAMSAIGLREWLAAARHPRAAALAA